MAKFSDLYEAVQIEDYATIQQFIQSGVDINCRDSRRRTVLHHTVEHMIIDNTLVEKLVDMGADVNARDISGMTPLHCATSSVSDKFIEKGFLKNPTMTSLISVGGSVPLSSEKAREHIMYCVEMTQSMTIECLLKLGADINVRFDANVTSLHKAVRCKSIVATEMLASLGVPVNAASLTGCTVFHQAVSARKTELLKRLVELGADVNASYDASFPIHEAVALARLDILRVLVKCGAEVCAEKMENLTSVYLALIMKNRELIECLADLGVDLNAKTEVIPLIHEVVKEGRVDMLEYLLSSHQSDVIDQQVMSSKTMLGIAVEKDNYEIAELLLKKGANVNQRFCVRVPALLLAASLGREDIVRALVKHGIQVDTKRQRGNTTVLFQVVQTSLFTYVLPRMTQLLLTHGAGVNLKFDDALTPFQDAVKRSDYRMVSVLAELGAVVDLSLNEEENLLCYSLFTPTSMCHMPLIKTLVEAGVNLNVGCNFAVTPLHVAVKQGDYKMVALLGELKADMNCNRTENMTPIIIATLMENSTVIRYLSGIGADLNVQTATATPLHDAVRGGDTDMVRTLISSGANITLSCRQKGLTALNFASMNGRNDALKVLVECGADVNLKSTRDISVLHDAIEYSNAKMITTLMSLKGSEDMRELVDQVTLLDDCCLHENLPATELLLEHGADKNCPQNYRVDLLDHAIQLRQFTTARFLHLFGETCYLDNDGSSPLHTACRFGHLDQARLLIVAGCDVNKCRYGGKKPLECLPFTDTVNYHTLEETMVTENIVEKVGIHHVPAVECDNMATILRTPGLGDVRYISNPGSDEVSERVRNLLLRIPGMCATFSSGIIKGIGSTAEGTRVGLPNEMDFLFEMKLESSAGLKEAGFGYVRYMQNDSYFALFNPTFNMFKKIKKSSPYLLNLAGSAGFHNAFIFDTCKALTYLKYTKPDQKVAVSPNRVPDIKDMERKACTVVLLLWDYENTTFNIPVDIVPGLHVDGWPEEAITKTWLMDYQELRSRGYVLVPKPPHVESDLAEKFGEEDLQTLWKISFPHLETEHMQRLEQRIKDVYLAAKSLRNPDVCRILITENGSLPKNVDKYVTSYALKMMLFKNVEYFQKSDLSLEEMVVKLYEDLHKALLEGFVPIFFLPKVNALSGTKLDAPKCAKVAEIMLRFVKALHQRDSQLSVKDASQAGADQDRPKSVYRSYEIDPR